LTSFVNRFKYKHVEQCFNLKSHMCSPTSTCGGVAWRLTTKPTITHMLFLRNY